MTESSKAKQPICFFSAKSPTSCYVFFIMFPFQNLRKGEFLGMVGINDSESLSLLHNCLTTVVPLAVTS